MSDTALMRTYRGFFPVWAPVCNGKVLPRGRAGLLSFGWLERFQSL